MRLSIPLRLRSLGNSEGLEHWPHGRDLSPEDALTRTWTGSTLILCDSVTQRRAIRTQIGLYALECGGQAATLSGRNTTPLISETWGIGRDHRSLRGLLDLLACAQQASIRETAARLSEVRAESPLILMLDTEPGFTLAQQEQLAGLREEGLLSLVSVTGRHPSL